MPCAPVAHCDYAAYINGVLSVFAVSALTFDSL